MDAGWAIAAWETPHSAAAQANNRFNILKASSLAVGSASLAVVRSSRSRHPAKEVRWA